MWIGPFLVGSINLRNCWNKNSIRNPIRPARLWGSSHEARYVVVRDSTRMDSRFPRRSSLSLLRLKGRGRLVGGLISLPISRHRLRQNSVMHCSLEGNQRSGNCSLRGTNEQRRVFGGTSPGERMQKSGANVCPAELCRLLPIPAT